MKKLIIPFLFSAAVIQLHAQEDQAGCKDHPMVNRMPNTVIVECTKNFDLVEMPVGGDQREPKEGMKTFISYEYTLEENTAPSFYQVVKNYENAVVKNSGRRLYYNGEEGAATLMMKTSAGKEVWLLLQDAGGVKTGNYALTIVEIEGMKQDITANDMLDALNKNGSIALQINFDTGKSTIKPESQKIVDEIATMLKADASLKVSIEGHTDNAGNAASNKTLSENRAKAVVDAVVAKGIDRSRLSSKGFGQEKPVADNSTEEGKAQNRRVEIVKK
jgi:outer membrane protein OmpA-like peptidoglycan-associated protein